MKKLLSVALIAVVLLVGCSKNDSDTIENSSNEQTIKALSETLMTEILINDFNNLRLTMDDTLKGAITDEQLSQVLATMTVNQNIKEVEDITVVKQANSQVVTVTIPLSSTKLNGIFSYDKDLLLTGLYFLTSPLTPKIVSTADFEEKAIQVGADGFELDGRLTLPKNVEKPPVAIIVSGSGPQGMDGILGSADNAMYRNLAHGLAQEGIASIRYNDRLYQYGNELAQTMSDITIEQEVLDDLFWTIDYASNLDSINSENIYLLGHSMGGMLAPYVAQQNNNVKGFISLAGSPNKLEDISLNQNEMVLSAQGTPKEQADELLKPLKEEIEKIKNLTKKDTTIVLGQPAGYWYSLSQVTGPEIASDINCPALILQGNKDFQVLEDFDYEYWKTLVDGNTNVEFMLFEGLNHLFMPSDGDTIDISEYNKPNTVSGNVIKEISNFILD